MAYSAKALDNGLLAEQFYDARSPFRKLAVIARDPSPRAFEKFTAIARGKDRFVSGLPNRWTPNKDKTDGSESLAGLSVKAKVGA